MAWALCIGERRASRAPWAQREALMSAEAVATLDEAMAMLESALILTLTLTRTLTRTLTTMAVPRAKQRWADWPLVPGQQ